jgi:hypothetical protein
MVITMKARGRISGLFEFNSTGGLKTIFLNAESEQDQKVLQRGLSDLLKPQRFEWIRRLFWK